jgi:hypothetical protein
MYVKEKKQISLKNPKLLNYWMKDVVYEKVLINNNNNNNNNNNKTYNKLNIFSKVKINK